MAGKWDFESGSSTLHFTATTKVNENVLWGICLDQHVTQTKRTSYECALHGLHSYVWLFTGAWYLSFEAFEVVQPTEMLIG